MFLQQSRQTRGYGGSHIICIGVVHFVVTEENDFGRYSTHQKKRCVSCEVQHPWGENEKRQSVACGASSQEPRWRPSGPCALPESVRLYIARDGYDRIEANTNGCCAQQKPVSDGGQAESSRTPFLGVSRPTARLRSLERQVLLRSSAVSLTAISIAYPGILRPA